MTCLSNLPDYVELAYSKDAGWRAWILDGPGPREPGHVLATGRGGTPDEACACAVLQWSGAQVATTAEPERGTCTQCGCVGQGACSESGGCFTAGAGSDAACDDGEPFADPLAAHGGDGGGAGWGSWTQRA